MHVISVSAALLWLTFSLSSVFKCDAAVSCLAAPPHLHALYSDQLLLWFLSPCPLSFLSEVQLFQACFLSKTLGVNFCKALSSKQVSGGAGGLLPCHRCSSGWCSPGFAACQALTQSQSELAADLWNKPWGKQQNTAIYL